MSLGILRRLMSWFHRTFKKPRSAGNGELFLGLNKDPRDERDFIFSFPLAEEHVPDFYIIPQEYHSEIKNQGRIGSCGSHGGAADLVEMEYKINKIDRILPLSELWHYYYVRSKEYGNTLPQDSGQTLRDMCKVLFDKGIAPEILWPYDTSKFNEKPSYWADMFAKMYKIKEYHRIASVSDIPKVLTLDHPIALGVYVTPAFMRHQGSNNIEPANDDKLLGGHCICLLGFDRINRRYRIKNSWGPNWGDQGYAWISEAYLLKYCLDMWHVVV